MGTSRNRSAALVVGQQEASGGAFSALASVCDITQAAGTSDALEHLKQGTFQAIFIDGEAPALQPGDLDALRAAAPLMPRVLVGTEEQAAFLAAADDRHLRFLPVSLPAPELVREAGRILQARSSPRHALADDGFIVRGTVEGRAFEYPLLDLSNRGLSFAVPATSEIELFLPGRTVEGLGVRDREGRPVLSQRACTVRHSRPDRHDERLVTRVGASFESPPAARTPFRLISEPVHVMSALRKAGRSGFVVSLEDTESSWLYDHTDVIREPEPGLLLSGPAPRSLSARDVVRLSFDHHGMSYTGLTSVIATENALKLALPRSLRVYHRRGSNRHRLGEGRAYFVRIRAAAVQFDRELPVYDLNVSGLSAVIDAETDLLPPGLILDELVLRGPDGDPIHLKGVVRSQARLPARPHDDLSWTARCGIEFTGVDEHAHRQLNDALVAEGFSRLEAARAGEFPAIWKLLDDAGFSFHLYGDGSQQSYETAERAFETMLGPGRSQAVNLIFRADGVMRGHVTGLRIYSRTWLATHLAARQGGSSSPADRITRALAMGMADHLENQPSGEFVKFLWQKEHRWVNRMAGWAGRIVHHPGLVDSRELTVLVRSNEIPPETPVSGIKVDDADESDLLRAERHFAQTMSPMRVRSEDLTREGLRLAGLEQEFARFGVVRRRHVRFARRGGTFLGFSLLEEATPALQLAEVTNSFDVFPASELDAEERDSVLFALIHDAIQFYSARGLSHTVARTEYLDPSAFERVGFRVADTSRSWTMHHSLLRGWAAAWEELFSVPKSSFSRTQG